MSIISGQDQYIGLTLVDTSKRGTRYPGAAEVVKLGRLGRNIADDIARAGTAGYLGQAESDVL